MKNVTLSGEMPRNSFAKFVVERRKTIVEVIAALFILLFVYTAINKILEFNTFQVVLKKSPLIGNINIIVARTLPYIEIFAALLLFIPKSRLLGLYGSLILMSIFTVYLGYMMAFTPDLPCTCGGVLKQMTWSQHLVFNIFFTLLALAGIILQSKSQNR